MDQLITEPTRITLSSRSLIDLCITNTPTKVAKFGVAHLAITDHALIYMTYKVQHERAGIIIIKTRQMKTLHQATILEKINEKPGTRFSKDPVTYRAQNRILKSKSREK